MLKQPMILEKKKKRGGEVGKEATFPRVMEPFCPLLSPNVMVVGGQILENFMLLAHHGQRNGSLEIPFTFECQLCL